MKIKNNKGYILMMAATFLIIVVLTSMGFYNFVYNIYKRAGIKYPENVIGYYKAIAGMRYAYILLKSPSGNLGFTPAPNDECIDISVLNAQKVGGSSGTVLSPTVTSDLGFLRSDIGLTSPHDLRIRITEITDPLYGVQYAVSVTYNN